MLRGCDADMMQMTDDTVHTDDMDDKMEVGAAQGSHNIIVYNSIWSFLEAYGVAVFGSKLLLELVLGIIVAVCGVCCCLAAITIKDQLFHTTEAVEGSEAERSALIPQRPIKEERDTTRHEMPGDRENVMLNFSI